MIRASESVIPLFELPDKNIPYVLGGSTLKGMDCVGLLRWWLAQSGIDCPYKNTHDFCRRMLCDFQPINGAVPVGAVVAIWEPTGAPSRYMDDFGNVSHVYVKIGDGTLLHASESNGRVLTRAFADKAVPNGGPTYFGLVSGLDYGLGGEAAAEDVADAQNEPEAPSSPIPAARWARVWAENGKPVKARKTPSRKDGNYREVPVGAQVEVKRVYGDGWAEVRIPDSREKWHMMTEFLREDG